MLPAASASLGFVVVVDSYVVVLLIHCVPTGAAGLLGRGNPRDVVQHISYRVPCTLHVLGLFWSVDGDAAPTPHRETRALLGLARGVPDAGLGALGGCGPAG